MYTYSPSLRFLVRLANMAYINAGLWRTFWLMCVNLKCIGFYAVWGANFRTLLRKKCCNKHKRTKMASEANRKNLHTKAYKKTTANKKSSILLRRYSLSVKSSHGDLVNWLCKAVFMRRSMHFPGTMNSTIEIADC